MMAHIARLVVLCREVSDAPSVPDRMASLYALRKFLSEELEPGELHVSVEHALADLEPHLDNVGKERLRDMGYQFPEDFDKPLEFLCD